MNLVHGDIYAFVHHRKSDMQVDKPRHIYIPIEHLQIDPFANTPWSYPSFAIDTVSAFGFSVTYVSLGV